MLANTATDLFHPYISSAVRKNFKFHLDAWLALLGHSKGLLVSSVCWDVCQVASQPSSRCSWAFLSMGDPGPSMDTWLSPWNMASKVSQIHRCWIHRYRSHSVLVLTFKVHMVHTWRFKLRLSGPAPWPTTDTRLAWTGDRAFSIVMPCLWTSFPEEGFQMIFLPALT